MSAPIGEGIDPLKMADYAVTGKRVFKMPSGFRVLATTAAVPPRYAGGAKTLATVSLLPQLRIQHRSKYLQHINLTPTFRLVR